MNILTSKQNNFLFQDFNKKTNNQKEQIISQIFYFTLNHQNSNAQRYAIKSGLDEYSFYLFSDFVVDSQLKETLLTINRTKKCHEFVLQFASQSENYTAVTGYISAFDKKILHSVLKTYFPPLNTEVYLDFTSNIIMDVAAYQKLFSFEVLNELTTEDIFAFEYSSYPFFDSYQEKMMLCFAKEFTRDLQRVRKGFQIFKKNSQ